MKKKAYYVKQYEATPQLAREGSKRVKYAVTYKGDYFRYDVSDKKLLQMRLLFAAAALLCIALFVGAGLLNTEGTRCMWVVLPYVALFLPLAFLAYDVVKQFFASRDMTERERDSVVTELKTATVGLVIVSGIASLAAAIFLLVGKTVNPTKEWLFLGMMVFLFIISFALWKYQKSIPVITIRQQSANGTKGSEK